MWRKAFTFVRKGITLDSVTTLTDMAAVGAITTGAALIYIPAGFITGGALAGFMSWYATRPPKQRKDDG